MASDDFVVTGSDGDKTLDTQRLCFRHMGILRGLVSGLVSDLSIAEELVQKVLNVIVTKAEKCPQDDQEFLTWARDIVFDELITYRKKHLASVHPLTEDVVSALAETVAHMDYAWQERQQALSECLKKLVGRNKEILELRYTQKMTPTRIVKEIGLGMGAVSVALVKARTALLECSNRALKTQGFERKRDFIPLLEGHLEERLDTKQKVELGEELFGSEDSRRIYWSYVFLHSALEELLAAEQIELPMGEQESQEEDVGEETPEEDASEDDGGSSIPERRTEQPRPFKRKKLTSKPDTKTFRYHGDPNRSVAPYVIGALIAALAVGSVIYFLLQTQAKLPLPIPTNVQKEVRVGTAAGYSRIYRGSRSFAVSAGTPVCENDRIETKGETQVVLNAGARLSFWKDSEAVFTIENMLTNVHLTKGAVEVVTHSETGGARMTVSTDIARFSVAGTRFIVAAGPRYTLLDVLEGSVFAARGSDETVIEVGAGKCSVIGLETEMLATDRQDDETMSKLASDIIKGPVEGEETVEPEVPEQAEPVEDKTAPEEKPAEVPSDEAAEQAPAEEEAPAAEETAEPEDGAVKEKEEEHPQEPPPSEDEKKPLVPEEETPVVPEVLEEGV